MAVNAVFRKGNAMLRTRMHPGDVRYDWDAKEIFDISAWRFEPESEDGQTWECLVNNNVAEPVLDCIAGFLGVVIMPGNLLSGRPRQMPLCMWIAQGVVHNAFIDYCRSQDTLLFPLDKETTFRVRATTYVWLSFLRVRGQDYSFLRCVLSTIKKLG